MRVTVEIKLPSGDIVALGHGAVIGRLWTAELHVNDARVSEAHAMISLRGRDVRLLALRGRFSVRGATLSDVVLQPGMRVALATGLELEVIAVRVPEAVFALQAQGQAMQVLTGVTSLFGGARPRIVSGWDAAAADWVWLTGEAWMRASDGGTVVAPGDTWQVNGATFHAVEQRVTGADATVREVDYRRPLKIVARFDTVHLVREGEAVVVISGHMARVISELVIAQTAIAWEQLAAQLWGEDDRTVLRRRWDMQLLRLRGKLRDHGVRQDLLRADGTGLVELVLGLADTVVDET